MKALSLLGVFVLARVLILIGRDIPLSAWTPVTFLWQDVLVVVLFATVDRFARRPWISWTIYASMTLYVAVNLPLTRLLSSPMTLPMLRATRGTLAESIRHHLTPENLLWIGAVLIAAGVMPFLLQRVRLKRRSVVGLSVVAAAVIVSGPLATTHVDTGGLHRNVLIALLTSAIPRVAAHPNTADWRASPSIGQHPDRAKGEDLSQFKGVAKGRNVVMVILESTGAQYLKPYGATEDPMPNLTALAKQAILFENAYAVYPESIKGLFSVLCSRYPAFDTSPETHAKVGTASISARLAEEGYRTALFHSGRFAYLGMDAIVKDRGFQTLEDAGHIGGNFNSSFGVEDKATVGRMLQWVDSAPRTERFFITYLPVAGHHPYDAPEPGPFPARDEPDRYRNALHYGDAVLGEFLAGLKACGLFDETLFVIFGDHGEAFGQHAGNYGHTQFIYEENVHVPYLIVAPGLVRETIRVRRSASLLDTAPTILDLLGLPPSSEYQGRSLLEPRAQMALFYSDYSLGFLGLRDGNWKLIYELESGRAKLFDLNHDSTESRNLAAEQPERVHAYQEHLKKWMAAQRNLILHPQELVAAAGRRS
jgi:arylsulfatase A-like enzyme